MAIASADDKLIPGLGELDYGAILFPAAQPAQFERVEIAAVRGDKSGGRLHMAVPTDSGQVPHRVIEDDQNAWVIV